MSFQITPSDTAVLAREARAAAQRLAGSLALPSHEADDVRQDLLTDAIARLKAYDPACGSLGAFAGTIMRRRAMRLARARHHERQVFGTRPVSLDQPLGNEDHGTVGDQVSEADGYRAWMGQPTDRFVEVEQRLDLERASQLLDQGDRDLCRALRETSPTDLVERRWGSRARLYRRVHEIRLVLTCAGLGPACDTSAAA